MPIEDAIRWNKRYQEEPVDHWNKPRQFLIEQAGWLPEQGLALDVAMGLGGNAAFLLDQGLRVIGVDISSEAVLRAKASHPELMAVIADLAYFSLPLETFDLITNFFFLQRELWREYRRALKPGGLLIMQSLTLDMLQVRPSFDPEFLLKPGELRRSFADWDILTYREGWEQGQQEMRAVAGISVRKPA